MINWSDNTPGYNETMRTRNDDRPGCFNIIELIVILFKRLVGK